MSVRPRLDTVAQQIKQIHAGGGSPLTKIDSDLVQRHYHLQIYMGLPGAVRVQTEAEILAAAGMTDVAEQATRKRRGRKPQPLALNQYEMSRQRWCGLYQQLVRLPALRKGTGYVDDALIERLFMTYHQQGTPRHKLVAQVLKHLQEQLPKLPCPDPRTLRRLLATAPPN